MFPLALSAELAAEHPVLASFGLEGSYESIFSFTTKNGGGQSRGTASRWNALFVGRIPLGHEAAGGTLSLDTGWQRLSWSQSAPVDVGVPDVRYDAVALGAGWDRAVAGHWALVDLRARLPRRHPHRRHQLGDTIRRRARLGPVGVGLADLVAHHAGSGCASRATTTWWRSPSRAPAPASPIPPTITSSAARWRSALRCKQPFTSSCCVLLGGALPATAHAFADATQFFANPACRTARR